MYQLLPGQNTTADMSSMIAANASGAPGWLASVDTRVAHFVNSFGEVYGKPQNQATTGMDMAGMRMSPGTTSTTPTHRGLQFILLLTFMQFGIGIGILFKGITRNAAVWLGILAALIFWVVGESLGSYYSGTATDPNSGPLLILLGLAILGCHTLDPRLAKLGSRFAKVITGETKANMEPDFES